MKKILIILVGLILINFKSLANNFIKYGIDENTRPEDYSLVDDPTSTYGKVHAFKISSQCGKIKRKKQDDIIGNIGDSDCSENSVRSEIYEEVWEDERPEDNQPFHRWYSWNVYLPSNFPIQESGKLLLGQFHNSECPHLSFTSLGGSDNGKIYYETMKLWKGDCKATVRKEITSIQKLRGNWINFTLEMKWSNDKLGVANLWLNGNQVLAHRGVTLTLQKEHTNFLKVGIYQCCNSKLIKPANALFTTPKSGPTRESVN